MSQFWVVRDKPEFVEHLRNTVVGKDSNLVQIRVLVFRRVLMCQLCNEDLGALAENELHVTTQPLCVGLDVEHRLARINTCSVVEAGELARNALHQVERRIITLRNEVEYVATVPRCQYLSVFFQDFKTPLEQGNFASGLCIREELFQGLQSEGIGRHVKLVSDVDSHLLAAQDPSAERPVTAVGCSVHFDRVRLVVVQPEAKV